jgi:hypothetical protein
MFCLFQQYLVPEPCSLEHELNVSRTTIDSTGSWPEGEFDDDSLCEDHEPQAQPTQPNYTSQRLQNRTRERPEEQHALTPQDPLPPPPPDRLLKPTSSNECLLPLPEESPPQTSETLWQDSQHPALSPRFQRSSSLYFALPEQKHFTMVQHQQNQNEPPINKTLCKSQPNALQKMGVYQNQMGANASVQRNDQHVHMRQQNEQTMQQRAQKPGMVARRNKVPTNTFQHEILHVRKQLRRVSTPENTTNRPEKTSQATSALNQYSEQTQAFTPNLPREPSQAILSNEPAQAFSNTNQPIEPAQELSSYSQHAELTSTLSDQPNASKRPPCPTRKPPILTRRSRRCPQHPNVTPCSLNPSPSQHTASHGHQATSKVPLQVPPKPKKTRP